MSEELKPFDKLLDSWKRAEGFTVWADDHAGVLRNLSAYVERHTRTPDHTALARQLVEALDEAEAIAKDHIKLLEEAKWTRAQAEEIILARTMLENIQQSIAAAKEAGF